MSLAGLDIEDLAELPSRRDEDWRWTDLRSLLREPLPATAPFAGAVHPGGPFERLGLDEITIANGRYNRWPEDTSRPGLAFFHHDAPDPPDHSENLPLARLAATHAGDPPVSILEFTKDGAALVRFISDATASAHHARLGIIVRRDVKATLLESYEGHGDDYLSNVLIEIFLERGARLERVIVADEAASSISASTAQVVLAPHAAFAQTVVAAGAKRQRLETHVAHPGEGALARLDGVYLLSDQRHADLTTVVTHAGVGGTTNQLTKGVVRDQARGVFQGRIVVKPSADKTDARMGHHALILSERAEVDAKPELEIFADDVQCAHGNTVGALDEDALFYAEQRGIPADEARAMLTEAFVGEVVDRIEHEGARDVVRAWVAERLRGAGRAL